ncbi:non-homologous end-joining DNA ligase [Allostreptomyces psammosilenae]|uniref:Bifunctional non-homologous end joining protein LigD n=1 Tax=Allostreptomyces psammosilenae TaxID=1892865 RepID=A0A852ZQW6_9ACTN|nr:non-homologous end-joining DNA ligase [Allostreptomyces psammosilenae]NYI03680.1 bifunctional non-homologous end joining protein LigD [Allostreptomyces psammosilenae]
MGPASSDTVTEVEGRRIKLSNLDKVLYPRTGFTKADVVHHYVQAAGVLLPRLADRASSLLRWPDGVEGESFFAKNAPPGTPDWVRTEEVTRERTTVRHVVVDDLPTLVWVANLAALELHVPQWRLRTGLADLMVLDLDPGPPATVVECCAVALDARAALAGAGLTLWPVTSGSKGLHLYAPIRPTPSEQVSQYAKALAQALEATAPDRVVHRMTKSLRPGKVFVDWSQNNAAKTTIAPYSLRGRELPTVATPVTWAEVESCRRPEDLRFLAADLPGRLDRHGDLLTDMADAAAPLPT